MADTGAINAWQCPKCGGLTVAVHVDEGVTPMFLACRRTDGCDGLAVSSGYPASPVPSHILNLLSWEWYRPNPDSYQQLPPEMRAHIDAGGLEIRPLTDAGRAAL